MELQDKLTFCRTCKNHKKNLDIGIYCGLTGAKPDFERNCEKYEYDKESFEEYRIKIIQRKNIESFDIIAPNIRKDYYEKIPDLIHVKEDIMIPILYFLLVISFLIYFSYNSFVKENYLLSILFGFIANTTIFFGIIRIRKRKIFLTIKKDEGLIIESPNNKSKTILIPWSKIVVCFITIRSSYGSGPAYTDLLIYVIGKDKPLKYSITSLDRSLSSVINHIEIARKHYLSE